MGTYISRQTPHLYFLTYLYQYDITFLNLKYDIYEFMPYKIVITTSIIAQIATTTNAIIFILFFEKLFLFLIINDIKINIKKIVLIIHR